MEDRSVVASVNGPADVIGVFDGHCGSEVSEYLVNNFCPTYVKELKKQAANPDISNSLDIEKTALDNTISEIDNAVIKSRAGSTASILVMKPAKDSKEMHYITCNVGDSRIVLSRSGKAVDLTVDHDPGRPDETARIEKAGGRVVWCGNFDDNKKPIPGTGK